MFFGCTPDEDAPMWSERNRGRSGPWSVCVSKPGEPFLYCFARREQMFWYYELGGASAFCEKGCRRPPELPPGCLVDLPDDNVSPAYPEHEPFPGREFWTECVYGPWPMKGECYVE